MKSPTATWIAAALKRFRASMPAAPLAEIDALLAALEAMIAREKKYRHKRALADSRSRGVRLREERRRAGLCITCGGPIESPDEIAAERAAASGPGRPRTGFACTTCLAASRARTARRTAKRKAAETSSLSTETSNHVEIDHPDGD